MAQSLLNPLRHLIRRQSPFTIAVEVALALLLFAAFWASRGALFPEEPVTALPLDRPNPQAENPAVQDAQQLLQARNDFSPAAGACEQLIVNGGFEQAGGWTLPLTARPAAYTTERAASGVRSLRLGIDADDRIAYSDSTGYQYVQLPAGVDEIVLQAKVWRTAAGQGNDIQYLLISAGSQSYTAFRSRVDETAWQEVRYDLTHLAGQRIRVLFGAFNTGGEGRVGMYVDDVAIYACTGGTATPTPAASPSPTVSPVQGMPLYLPILQRPGPAGPETTPTVTPTPGPGCTEAVVNGGFEANGGWTMPTTARPARYASEQVWQGSRSLRLGIPPGGGNAQTDSTAYQWVNLPGDAATITLTAHVWRGGGSSGDFHYLWITAGGKTDRLFQGLEDSQRWQEVTYDLTPLAGQRIFLLLGTFNDGVGGAAVMYVDEVSIQACPPNVTPTPPTPTPTPTATPIYAPPATVTSPDFGANAFLWWRPEIAERDLTLMKAAGFRWVRQSFMWEDMEQHGKGQFVWEHADRVVQQVNESGLSLLARLGTDPDRDDFWAGAPPDSLEDFVDFVAALARRYNCTPEAVGCIQAYQVWNEPNLAREWGGHRPNPRQYVTMLGQAYAAIKAANPNALVISAGMAPTGTDSAEAMPDETFYREMYRAMGGDSDGYFDLLGVHGAGFAAPPETDPGEVASNPALGGHRFFSFRHVEDIRAIMVANGDQDKRMAVLEFGWTSDPVNPEYYWHGAGAGIDEFVKADYLKRAYIWAAEHWQPWIGLMSVLTMPNLDWLNDGDPFDEEQYWWAILEPSQVDELRLRPAFVVLCEYFNGLNGAPCPYSPPEE